MQPAPGTLAGRDPLCDLCFEVFRSFHTLRPGAWMRLDLTMPQFKVVTMLSAQEPLPISAIAGRLEVSVPTASGIVERLYRQGLVDREEGPSDRRVVLVRLTPDGRSQYARLFESNRGGLENVLGRMNGHDRAALERGLTSMVQAIRDFVVDHHPSGLDVYECPTAVGPAEVNR